MNPELETTKAQVLEVLGSIDHKLYPEISMQQLLDVLGLTIKEDDVSKLITFYCMLSA